MIEVIEGCNFFFFSDNGEDRDGVKKRQNMTFGGFQYTWRRKKCKSGNE